MICKMDKIQTYTRIFNRSNCFKLNSQTGLIMNEIKSRSTFGGQSCLDHAMTKFYDTVY